MASPHIKRLSKELGEPAARIQWWLGALDTAYLPYGDALVWCRSKQVKRQQKPKVEKGRR